MPSSSSSRWCPTPEQLMILEEMYRSGIRTPNATQIQQTTAHLSLYGKIEGKNVFYWFQNHKARERQKLRRKLLLMHHQQHQQRQLVLQQQLLCHHRDHHFNPIDDHSTTPLILHHQLPHQNSVLFSQAEGENSYTELMNYKPKLDLPEKNEMESCLKRMYGRDWKMMMMLMMDIDPSTPCCDKPIKTLQLFPINNTTTRLKD